MNLYNMKLGDSEWWSGPDIQVTRVPGGWIYGSTDSNGNICSQIFVPFNTEFMENSEPSYLADSSAGTPVQQLTEAIALVRDNSNLLMSTDRESFLLKLAALEATASV